MINFEHDKTLILGERTGVPDFAEATARCGLLIGAIVRVEWCCWACGDSGQGFMPERHASGTCDATRTIVTPSGYVDGGGI